MAGNTMCDPQSFHIYMLNFPVRSQRWGRGTENNASIFVLATLKLKSADSILLWCLVVLGSFVSTSSLWPVPSGVAAL